MTSTTTLTLQEIGAHPEEEDENIDGLESATISGIRSIWMEIAKTPIFFRWRMN